MNQKTIEGIAETLRRAHRDRVPCDPVRDALLQQAAASIRPLADMAYAVQQANTDAAVREGRRIVGRKIGLTSLAVQKQLGVDEPDFGVLFADMARLDGLPIACADVLQPKVEAEVALVLERDLDSPCNTIADLIRATAFVLPAIEICGSRVRGWDIRLADTVADNASAGLFVLGTRPVRLGDVELGEMGMSMRRGEEVVSEGRGTACMGHPLNAALWLADTLARLGTPLRAGEIVLTGALGPMVPVRPGDVFRADIEGLGTVSAAFTDDAR